MTLNGGDPDSLTLRRFLDVAQAIIVHEMVRSGVDLMTALEQTREFAVGSRREEAEGNGAAPQMTAVHNDAALAELQRALGGVNLR